MNPSRLWVLFDSYFRPKHKGVDSHSMQTGENDEFSLSKYLTGGV